MLYFLCYKQQCTICSPVLCSSFNIKGILVLILMGKKKKVFFQTLRSDNLTNRNTWYFTMFSKYTTLESTFVSEIRPPRIILYKSFLLQEMFKTIMPSGPQLYRVRAKLSIHSFFVRGLSDKYIYRQYNLFVFLL